MHVIYLPPRQGSAGFEERCFASGAHCTVITHQDVEHKRLPSADVCILGQWVESLPVLDCPVLVHSPCVLPYGETTGHLGRICAWPGFWEQPCWEVAISNGDPAPLAALMAQLGITMLQAPDTDGMIAPGILATLINEAVYALDMGVADAASLDVAMQLGTNYPRGPLAWAAAIGYEEVHALLKAKAVQHPRYQPHPQFFQILAAHG